MQVTEKINYDNYEFMYDKNGYSRGEGIPIFKDVFDFYDVIEDFYLNEIKDKSKDLSELGKYLDYNFEYNSYQGKDFLHYLHFVYEPYFNHNLTDYRFSWIEEFNPIHQYEIAKYVKNWINKNVELMGKNSLNDLAKGLIVSEMYATLPTKAISTSPPEVEEKKKKQISKPTLVVMLEVAETINRIDKFLPETFINATDKIAKYKKAIFDKFGFDYSESTIKNNIFMLLTDKHRLKVVKMLNDYGRMDLANQYQIQYKCTA